MTLPDVVRALHVQRPPEAVFDLFTGSIGAWWPLGGRSVYHGESAEVAFRGSRLEERSVDGRVALWADVVRWDPPHGISLRWHPGVASATDGTVTVEFAAIDGRGGSATRVELTHSGWESALPRGWGAVLDHFADVAERGSPVGGPAATDAPGADGMDLVALSAAYEAFWAEADAGGFGEPDPGEWSAPRLLAHIAVNDGLLAAVTRALIEDQPLLMENLVSTDVAVLDAWVGRHGGEPAALATAGRERARLVVTLLRRLDDGQAAAVVPTRLVDAGQVVLDGEMPWSRLMGIQLAGHLPGHTRQLRALRR